MLFCRYTECNFGYFEYEVFVIEETLVNEFLYSRWLVTLLLYCGGLVDWCGDDCGGCDSNLVFSEVPRLIDLDLDF